MQSVSPEVLVVPNDVLAGHARFLPKSVLTTVYCSELWEQSVPHSRVPFSVVCEPVQFRVLGFCTRLLSQLGQPTLWAAWVAHSTIAAWCPAGFA